MKRGVTVRISWPVFWAALQLILAIILFVVASIVYRWPVNLLPGLYLMTSTVCYGLVVWAAREGRPHE